ncbi:MAG: hypothetical protein WCG27_03770, partial [Pseudomonadota bacterium]
VKCNKILIAEMERDTRATFSKAEAVLKCSDTYLSYKNIMGLKQCASRGLNLARLHAQHLLKSGVINDLDSNAADGGWTS